MNIPLSGQFASWAGTLIDLNSRPVLIADTSEQFAEARTRLARIGLKHNAAFRKQKAAEYGIGFELPASVSVVPNVPKTRLKTKRAKAA